MKKIKSTFVNPVAIFSQHAPDETVCFEEVSVEKRN